MSLRCYRCGGHAVAALAHLHGLNGEHLCKSCSDAVIALRREREEAQALEAHIQELVEELVADASGGHRRAAA